MHTSNPDQPVPALAVPNGHGRGRRAADAQREPRRVRLGLATSRRSGSRRATTENGDPTGLLPTDGDYGEFVRSLDAKNEQWVVGAGALSRRLVVDLLRWSGREVDAFYASVDLEAPSRVIWASDSSMPLWFDMCRDLTERWVHQQHIRDAVRCPGSHDRFLPDVLRTFVWAFSQQYRARAPEGTVVQLGLGIVGTWHLVRSRDRWSLEPGSADKPAALIDHPAAVAWRQLTGFAVSEEPAVAGLIATLGRVVRRSALGLLSSCVGR